MLNLFSIQRYARDVCILFRLVCRDRKYLSVSEFHGRFVKERRSQDKLVATRANGVETKAAQQVPSGHLPAILVTDNPLGSRLVHLIQQAAGPFLGFPRLAYVAVQVSHVVARLVAMRVLTDQSGNVYQIADYLGGNHK